MNSKKKQKKSTADFLFRRERCKDLPRIKTGVGRCARVPRGVPTYRHDCGISSFTSFASQNSWKKKKEKKIPNKMETHEDLPNPEQDGRHSRVSPRLQQNQTGLPKTADPRFFIPSCVSRHFCFSSFPPSFLPSLLPSSILVDPSEYGSV